MNKLAYYKGYMEKEAFKYAKPGKLFNLVDPKDIERALFRQGPKWARKLSSYGDTKARLKAALKNPGNTLGTVVDTPKGRRVLINKLKWAGLNKAQRRALLAHEGFHAKGNPAIRNSEWLAHWYGGKRSGSTLVDDSPAMKMLEFAVSRPVRATGELVAGPPIAAGKAVKQLVGK